MIKTMIIDDEPHARDALRSMLADYINDIHILAEASSASEAYDKIIKYKPDVIFLDVEMPMGTGFDLLSKFTNPDFKVIFVTGFDQYALNAIKFSALDYLLKPVNIQELRKAVEKVRQTKKTNQDLVNFVNVIKNPKKQSNKLAVTVENGFEFVPVSQIVYCEADLQYTIIHMNKAKHVVSSYNIGEYEDMLTEYDFFRIHTSYVINRSHIIRFVKEGDSGILYLSENIQLPVSRRRKTSFLEWMNL